MVVIEGVPNAWGDGEDLREHFIREGAKADWFGNRDPYRLSQPLMEGGRASTKVEMRSWMAADSFRNFADAAWNARVRGWRPRRMIEATPSTPRGRISQDREGFTYIAPRGDKRKNQERVEAQKRIASGCYRCGKPGHYARDCRAETPRPAAGTRGPTPHRK